ncbi:hypothetical protein HHK36_008133 [Tetracentron sinense]|uniref:Homeobox-leucine zipper protein n=1 Tax=Tetracentron sinense TaxID=13715 RepID=A0A835DJ07_TETSI|nr:hypothetical protein HHK36_008133 [Tetracentron sinense]
MKRLGSSCSLISICPSTDEKSPGSNHVYSMGFQSMLDGLNEEDCAEELGQTTEKKRRLNVDQVKALETNFEVENKLEPERKVKLAQELGLQPRQVAIWFQNRRARWKTKQLGRDYGLLKANYEALKLSYDNLLHDKEALLVELKELKPKLQEENTNLPIKEEVLKSETEYKAGPNGIGVSILGDFRDGSSDSDSSGVLNEEISPNAAISSSGVLEQHQLMNSPASSSLRFNCYSSSPSSIDCFQFSNLRAISENTQKANQEHDMRIGEHNLLSTEESCDFLSDDQAPSLQWYYPDQWN